MRLHGDRRRFDTLPQEASPIRSDDRTSVGGLPGIVRVKRGACCWFTVEDGTRGGAAPSEKPTDLGMKGLVQSEGPLTEVVRGPESSGKERIPVHDLQVRRHLFTEQIRQRVRGGANVDDIGQSENRRNDSCWARRQASARRLRKYLPAWRIGVRQEDPKKNEEDIPRWKLEEDANISDWLQRTRFRLPLTRAPQASNA